MRGVSAIARKVPAARASAAINSALTRTKVRFTNMVHNWGSRDQFAAQHGMQFLHSAFPARARSRTATIQRAKHHIETGKRSAARLMKSQGLSVVFACRHNQVFWSKHLHTNTTILHPLRAEQYQELQQHMAMRCCFSCITAVYIHTCQAQANTGA